MAAAAFSYRSQDHSSDSDSENSDTDVTDWKRATRRTKAEILERIPIDPPAVPAPEEKPGPPKRKRNNIWSDVLEDQMMSETLNYCGIKNKPKDFGSRGSESYDYTLKYKYLKRDDNSDDNMSEDENLDSLEVNSVTSFKSKKFQSKRYVKLDGAGLKAAKKIVQTLGEKKQYLIFRVVKHVGIEKAMKLLKETEEIEENGGMMVKNQQRRRTPGGVYFQLLKADKDLKKTVLDQIFEGELNSFEMKRKADLKRNKRKIEKEKKKLLLQLEEKFESKQKQSEKEEDENVEVMEEGEVEVPPVLNVPVCPNERNSDLEDGEIND